MPLITRIVQQQKNKRRFSLFVDDKFFCGIDEELLLKFGLKKGDELSDEKLNELFSKSEINKLFNRALDFLSRRPRSQREVRTYLVQKLPQYKINSTDTSTEDEHDEVVINSIIERLESFGYVNDRYFTGWWIDQRTQTPNPKGRSYIVSELMKKGISRDIIESVWAEKGVDESEAIRAQLEKLLKRYDPNSPKERQKIIQALVRRGFRWEAIQTVLK